MPKLSSTEIFLLIVQIMLLSAKLFGFITWSWWIVTLPLSIPFSIVLLYLLILGSKAHQEGERL